MTSALFYAIMSLESEVITMKRKTILALLALSGVVVKETKAYFNHLKQEEITTTTALEKEVA